MQNFLNSKTAKIDSNFTNVSFNMLLSCSSKGIYGCINVSVHCFYNFYIPILHYENYDDRRPGNKKTEIFNFISFSICQITTSVGL